MALATVLEGGAGLGGLSAGDVLVAIDGLRVDAPAGLELLLAQYRPGDRVTIHVFRRDELRAFRVRLGAPQALDCVLSESASAGRPARRPAGNCPARGGVPAAA